MDRILPVSLILNPFSVLLVWFLSMTSFDRLLAGFPVLAGASRS